ncbi:hypothetical protein OSSY52_13380 [Tepiditoga spiralis]|uniref:Response regulatory domain-containing protein n=1 Tax=Tepiditoga spiralis TaxID=2108365 RepID=A0A7G1G8C3_9BACT|nr:DUF3369 domain-containing protein [Tepiditoga spiralis]BBE31197.1 hypothetical protein OSSY52_13380 [Tepiditoga spiralis]
MNDNLIFSDEDDFPKLEEKPWKILIADDDHSIHAMTKLVVNDIIFENKKIQCFSAYSGKETLDILNNNEDIALVLLDVIMEEEDTGLKVVKQIRENLKNKKVRIILRTGQPGQAPEKMVVSKYDINDYKTKTELTVQKMYTTIIAALRAYKELEIIENSKKALCGVIEASIRLFESKSIKNFASELLKELSYLLEINKGIIINTSGMVFENNEDNYEILACSGEYEKNNVLEIKKLEDEVKEKIKMALKNNKSYFYDNEYIGYFKTETGKINLVYLNSESEFSELDKKAIEIFSRSVAVGYDNIYYNQKIIKEQKEKINKLNEYIEKNIKKSL